MTKVFVRWCRGMDMVVCVASCVSQMQAAVHWRTHVNINTDNVIIHQQMPPGNLAVFECCNMRA